jgi:cytochrome c553
MPSFYRRLAAVGAVSLLMFGLMSWAGADPASSGTSNVVHGKQFFLPPAYGTDLMRSQKRGKALYLYYCGTCHGDTGNSDGFNSYSLKKPPPKFSDVKFMQSLSDDIMRRAIKEGGRGVGLSPQMPHWKGVLSDQNVTDLIHFIHELTK